MYCKGVIFEDKNGVCMRLATEIDFGMIWQVIEEAKELMALSGRSQWNDKYPNQSIIRQDILSHNAFVLARDGEVAAYGVVVKNGEPHYEHLKIGKWTKTGDYYVIHRLAVGKHFRGCGIASFFFHCVEQLCRQTGVASIRVDTNYDNREMLAVLKKCGFSYCGIVDYPVNGEREVFEKVWD